MPLENDCFAYGEYLMPFKDGLRSLMDRVQPVSAIAPRDLSDCLGATLGEDLIAGRAVPPHNNAAVDGYAVFFDDLNKHTETTLPVTARIPAGHPLGREAKRGEALRIFTGAVMPDGPDTIFMEEDVTIDGDRVVLPTGIKQGANRRLTGEDIQQGDAIIKAGQRLRPQDLGLAASVGAHQLPVRTPLKVAVFSTGDEIFDPSGDVPSGCVFDANRFSIMAMLESFGCQVTDLGILKDDPDVLRDALAGAAETHQAIITSGGVSLGEEDHVKDVVKGLGALHLWRLAIKPGRPIAFGQIGQATFIGLPGNPVAALVTGVMIARPVLLGLMGRRDLAAPTFQVRAGDDFKKKSGRTEWQRALLGKDDQGGLVVRPFRRSGAGILTSMTEADGLVQMDEEATLIKAGDAVNFIPFDGVFR